MLDLTEEQEQEIFVEYLEKNKLKFSALPLSTFTKSWAVKNRNKKMGVRAGVPDMMIIVKNKLVFIEMKRKKTGKISDYQKSWLEELNKCEGVQAFVCYGYEESKKIIDNIIKLK